MSQIDATLAGDGALSLGGLIQPTGLVYAFNPAASVLVQVNPGPIGRTLHAGWLAFGYKAGELTGFTRDLAQYFTYLDWAGGDPPIPPFTDTARWLFYHIVSGLSVQVRVYY